MQKHLGIKEIALAVGYGTTRQAVSQWRTRRKLPPPADILSTGPLWHKKDVRAFIAQARAEAEKRAAGR